MSADKSELLQALRIDRGDREAPAEPRRLWWIVGIIAAVVIAAGTAFFFLRGDRFEVEVATAVAPAANGKTGAVLQATGYVTARREATVSAQITGKLTEVLIEEGEQVTAGQVLARLENNSQRAALAQAQAQLEAGQASLEQYKAQLAQNRRDLARSQDLVERKLVSQQALETARTQVETMTAQVQSQQKQIELAQASVRGAQVQLDYTTVRAPFAGIIIAKAAQAGEIISPISAGGGFTRTGVGTIVDMDSLEIEVDVNEQYINRVKPQQPAEAVLDAYQDWTIPAHVIAIIPTADRSKATVKVRIALELKDPRILPDMGVRVSFLEEASPTSSQRPKGVLVPATALVEREGHAMVFVVDGERARAQPVTAGQSYNDLRLVEGVADGVQVVKAPPAQMNDGARIVIKK